MSVYVYRLTMKTVRCSNGEMAHVMECLGKGPGWWADNAAQSRWDRKIDTGKARLAKVAHSGLYVEDSKPGSPVYVGSRGVYPDSIDYIAALDRAGNPVTVA